MQSPQATSLTQKKSQTNKDEIHQVRVSQIKQKKNNHEHHERRHCYIDHFWLIVAQVKFDRAFVFISLLGVHTAQPMGGAQPAKN